MTENTATQTDAVAEEEKMDIPPELLDAIYQIDAEYRELYKAGDVEALTEMKDEATSERVQMTLRFLTGDQEFEEWVSSDEGQDSLLLMEMRSTMSTTYLKAYESNQYLIAQAEFAPEDQDTEKVTAVNTFLTRCNSAYSVEEFGKILVAHAREVGNTDYAEFDFTRAYWLE